jgi:FAD/FMN-containing dehydrogenase/Fe-S oxidoreductase
MLPRIIPAQTMDVLYQDYIEALKTASFNGEIRTDYAARLAVATDNSVYQVVPQAVIFPKTIHDIATALQLTQKKEFQEIQFAPRGGGTGTNGQSLSAGIIIDCSQSMRNILEINLQENWVRVQPGVVLDQLNVYLKSHNRCFATQISPSNRATLGGMVNTDACGNGSKTLGRTSDHVINLICVMANGTLIETENNKTELCKQLSELIAPKQTFIREKFIERPRNLNGYNLLQTYTDQINLNHLICGSEGTLAIVGEIKLKIHSIPAFKKMILIKYRDFDDALRDHELEGFPCVSAIEAIDEKLVELARDDSLYFQIASMLDNDVKAGAVNLVELIGDNEEELNQIIQTIVSRETKSLGFYFAKNATEINLLWELRKKSVGLISKKQQGTRRPIPFVEDTAVPPERLADYIREFKHILDQHQLIYGMYGHVDAGCVHVRPALDLKQTDDEALFKNISDAVAKLVEKFGGVMWGEHGMGYRCHYAEHFFGKELYFLIRQIKTLFDPNNRLNPGKIAAPITGENKIVGLTDSLRATVDKQIPAISQHSFPSVMACNGNGACFNFSTQDAMCPSYKATKDRIHSPKGRATLMRAWLHQLGAITTFEKTGIKKWFQRLVTTWTRKDFSHEVYAAMNGCLSCKACASQCPLNVDVPEFKAKFLSLYHQRYLRPLRDYLIAHTEKIAMLLAYFPCLSAWILQKKVVQSIIKQFFKMVDLPIIAYPKHKVPVGEINNSSISTQPAVILLQDAFTSFYEPELLTKTYHFLMQLGINVYVLPFFPNGKPLHVRGFLRAFSKTAHKNIMYLREIAKMKIPMIGLDPSITLTYRDEYQKLLGNEALGFDVKLLQEWLVTQQECLAKTKLKTSKKHYYLLSHCTEKTACVAAEKQWQDIYAALGLMLTPLAAGCCGMAGSYGHEVEHQQESKILFSMDWQRYLRENADIILATGYSCRSQVKRLQGMRLRHPIEVFVE